MILALLNNGFTKSSCYTDFEFLLFINIMEIPITIIPNFNRLPTYLQGKVSYRSREEWQKLIENISEKLNRDTSCQKLTLDYTESTCDKTDEGCKGQSRMSALLPW